MPTPTLDTPLISTVLSAPHRIAMAPMTRMRTTQPGDIPNDLMAEYYAQRADAALIVTEATQISPQGKGYSHTPGIHTDAQVAGWRRVTEAVHRAGGRIFCQLWHVGRMSHSVFHDGAPPVAPSAIAPHARVFLVDPDHPQGHMVDCPTPRALDTDEIPGIVADFAAAAQRAMQAGFDGVEVHGANGYLLDQFLRRTSNTRLDAYGGSIENRTRLAREVVDAVVDTVGADRTGLRIGPHIKERGMDDPEAVDAVLHLAAAMDRRGIAYLHLVEADWDDAPAIPDDFRADLRARFGGLLIAAGGYDRGKAERMLGAGYLDLVAFGRPYVANPDLVDRLLKNRPLADYDPDRLYGGGRDGYIY